MKWTTDLLQLVFLVITIVTNIISASSEVSSTIIFIKQYAVEMAILRSIGFTQFQIYISYLALLLIQNISLLNSFILIMLSMVISPLLIGMSIGIIVSYLICIQESLIINIPLSFQVSISISFYYHFSLLYNLINCCT